MQNTGTARGPGIKTISVCLVFGIAFALLLAKAASNVPEEAPENGLHWADITGRIFNLTDCTPASIDGKQVFVIGWTENGCGPGRAIVSHIADYKLELLCSTTARTCVHISEMDETQREYYDEKRQYARAAPGFKRCERTTSGGILEMFTAGRNVDCRPHTHGARYYDKVLGVHCVMLGSTTVGCTPQEQHISQRL